METVTVSTCGFNEQRPTNLTSLKIRTHCDATRLLTIIIELDNTPAPPYKIVDCSLRRIDGRTLPDWLTPSHSTVYAGVSPTEVDHLDLKASALIDQDDHIIVRAFRVNARTGAITWLPSEPDNQPAMFRDQITRFTEFDDESAKSLAALLREKNLDP
jgi:hypothetical protein